MVGGMYMYEDYMDNLFDRRPMPTVAPKVGDIFLYTVNDLIHELTILKI